jgi:hypothetical protein
MKPDRGRVVAHAYRDDAVIAICRQKVTHCGAMALVLALVQVHRRVGSEPNPPGDGGKGGENFVEIFGVSLPWSCCAVRWCHQSRCTLRDICPSGRVSCTSRAVDSVVSLRQEVCGIIFSVGH